MAPKLLFKKLVISLPCCLSALESVFLFQFCFQFSDYYFYNNGLFIALVVSWFLLQINLQILSCSQSLFIHIPWVFFLYIMNINLFFFFFKFCLFLSFKTFMLNSSFLFFVSSLLTLSLSAFQSVRLHLVIDVNDKKILLRKFICI